MSSTPNPRKGTDPPDKAPHEQQQATSVAGKTPGKTPSKNRVELGTASNYYFKYMNSSVKKKNKNGLDTSSILLDDENISATFSLSGVLGLRGDKAPSTPFKTNNDTSILSIGLASTTSSSSAGSEDLLNKSTLSDTTELTASNFVLAATSRQKLRALAKEGMESKSSSKPVAKDNEVASPAKQSDGDSVQAASSASKMSISEPKGTSTVIDSPVVLANTTTTSTPLGGSSISKQSPAGSNSSQQSMSGGSPSLRSRFSASPGSLRALTASLKDSRMKRMAQRQEDNKRRHSAGGADNSVSLLIQEKMSKRRESSASLMVSRPRLPPSSKSVRTPEIPAIIGGSVADKEKVASVQSAKVPTPSSGSTTDILVGAVNDLFRDLGQPNVTTD